MRVLITGSSGMIGEALASYLMIAGEEVIATRRRDLDLLNLGDLKRFPEPQVVYLCAAKTRFIDCESDPTAYRINVDAQIALAKYWNFARIVFLSSEAVERALHTNYGMHKALAEQGLRGVCDPVIARICGKVTKDTLSGVVSWLAGLLRAQPGLYRWSPTS